MMKKKKMLTLILTVILGYGALGQNYVILVQPVGSKEWGYSDLNGNLIIDAKYKNCIGFSEDGYAAIYDGKLKQFSFINIKGETLKTEVTDYKLIEVLGFGMKGFRDGMAPVEIKDKWGFLNTDGKLAIQPQYDKVYQFKDGFTTVQKNGQFFALDKNGNEYPIDVQGLADVNDFSEQRASFKTSGDMVGFVDGSGKVVIEAKFKSAGDFHNGLAWAKSSAGKVGYINPQGEWVIEPKFDGGKNYDLESDRARIKTGDKWGYVNKAGEIMYVNDSETFDDFSNGLAKGKKNGKFGFFNTKGEWAIEPQFDGARDFSNGYASVKQGEKWGIIDTSGKWVVEPKFEEIKDVEVVR